MLQLRLTLKRFSSRSSAKAGSKSFILRMPMHAPRRRVQRIPLLQTRTHVSSDKGVMTVPCASWSQRSGVCGKEGEVVAGGMSDIPRLERKERNSRRGASTLSSFIRVSSAPSPRRHRDRQSTCSSGSFVLPPEGSASRKRRSTAVTLVSTTTPQFDCSPRSTSGVAAEIDVDVDVDVEVEGEGQVESKSEDEARQRARSTSATASVVGAVSSDRFVELQVEAEKGDAAQTRCCVIS